MLLSPPVQSGESVSSGETVKLVMVNTSFPKSQFCLEAQTESLVTIPSVVFLEGRDSLGSFLRKRLPNTQTERALVRRPFRQRPWGREERWPAGRAAQAAGECSPGTAVTPGQAARATSANLPSHVTEYYRRGRLPCSVTALSVTSQCVAVKDARGQPPAPAA